MVERAVINELLLVLPDWQKLMRNTVGGFWSGIAQRLSNGDIMIKNPRRIKVGLGEGSSDLIGFEAITITPDMVGQKIARFLAVEVKTGKVALTPAQRHYIDFINSLGGRAVVVRARDDKCSANQLLDMLNGAGSV